MLSLLFEACVVGNYLTLLLIGLSLIIISHCRLPAASCSRMPNPNTSPGSALFIVDRFIWQLALNHGNLKGRICKFWILFRVWNIVREIEMSCENNWCGVNPHFSQWAQSAAKLACVQNKRKGSRSMFALPLPLSSSSFNPFIHPIIPVFFSSAILHEQNFAWIKDQND